MYNWKEKRTAETNGEKLQTNRKIENERKWLESGGFHLRKCEFYCTVRVIISKIGWKCVRWYTPTFLKRKKKHPFQSKSIGWLKNVLPFEWNALNIGRVLMLTWVYINIAIISEKYNAIDSNTQVLNFKIL